ncbi:Fe-S cluster carrier protein ApbC [Halobacterium hubeiense]|jgi:ATP-binding protein involved in chromosome partitioning|uniref:Iron-sulfur cluster carrier protein n=1 Tax=Halobacterium hubeiense TaxID=1407499 RepID=A0A0U5H797_9EURY|nr:Mrp/NBP35 family ATP-binding protein [Halobacterium hubeiense]CQH61527.1 Fe-S cluster carrier protein ApbC [Halobacterium hubeiense]
MTTAPELRARLADVEDPLNDDDIVSMGLVNDVAVNEDTARVELAFNAPYSPAEIEIGNDIRDVVEDANLEPDLRANVGEEHGFDDEILPGVKNVVAVASGKGGVGKTTVAANLAAGLNDRGARVGILDADVHGPNVPRILPTENEPGVTPDGDIVPPASEGVRVMSTDHMMPDGDEPAVMRGPMVNNVMMKFINEVQWGRLDYLVVDLPPGTGDASLNLLQTLPVAGVVVVTTPQEMAVADARKGLKLFAEHDAPVLGVVENMSAYHCPNCEDTHEVFGSGGAAEISDDYDVPVLAELPVHPDFDSESGGPTIRDEDSGVREDLFEFVDETADRVGEINRRKVAEHLAERGDDVPEEADAPAGSP